MVTKVNATTDYRLLAGADAVIKTIARDALVSFSINRLRELKLVTANFKNGYDFSDGYYLRYDLKKFYKLIQNTIYRAIGFLEASCDASYPFIDIRNSRAPSFRIQCMYDPSVVRYVRMLNRHFMSQQLPYTISCTDYYEANDYMRVDFYCNADRTDTSLQTYKLLMLIPEGLTILRTLSRKARLSNEQFRSLNRSGRIGYTPSPAA